MSFDPLDIVIEILGEPAAAMRNPVNAGYQCPFINSICVKQSHRISGSYPLCTIRQGERNPEPTCVCPKRFYEIDLVGDIIKHCWPGDPPTNPRVAHEVQMYGFGNVDFVLADIDKATGKVKNFVSVELQAVDISGSVESAYSAVLNSQNLAKRPSYGINWANVRKRFISQLIAKGFFHHQWGTRMIAVIQTSLYKEFRKYIDFDELPAAGSCNIVFMLYSYQPKVGSVNGELELVLDRAVGTSHSSLMTGTLYRSSPPREAFCDKIIENLV